MVELGFSRLPNMWDGPRLKEDPGNALACGGLKTMHSLSLVDIGITHREDYTACYQDCIRQTRFQSAPKSSIKKAQWAFLIAGK